jgi:hypothetical protein
MLWPSTVSGENNYFFRYVLIFIAPWTREQSNTQLAGAIQADLGLYDVCIDSPDQVLD